MKEKEEKKYSTHMCSLMFVRPKCADSGIPFYGEKIDVNARCSTN
jgi:hypothetical protein